MPIVTTEDVLHGKPRLEGRRISVLQVAEMVIDADRPPERVADELDVGLDEIHEALAYYYRNPEEMTELREEKRERIETLEERSSAPRRIEE